MLRRALPRGRKPHVCIVGAGVSGLRCADILLQAGIKVTILEARNRIGGRLCQATHCGNVVDLGPNWIHGTDDNPILDLAKETGTATHSWDGRQSIFDDKGEPISEEEAHDCSETVWTIIGQAMAYSKENSASIPADKSLRDFIKEKTQEKSRDFPELALNTRKQKLMLQVAEMWGAFVGSPLERQSLKFYWLEECIDGENLFVAGTYGKILAHIAAPTLKNADVRFGQQVSKIISSGEDQTSSVKVELSNGESLEFDEVVMTTPLGWLKRNKEAFIPPLPPRLSDAISNIGYGCLDKFYITFPSAFWDIPNSNTTAAPPPPALQNISNTTSNTAPLHQSPNAANGTTSDHHPGFTQWTCPTYADTNPEGWNQECVNMASLPAPHAHPTLLFYTFGPTSQSLAEVLRTQPADAADAAILAFFKPYYARLPNYASENPDCQPVGVLSTNWTNDEFAGYGSYCNFQVGVEAADADIETMRAGMPERRVWLAGEHTASFLALGTVTGAYWSGEGVGRLIVGAYGEGSE
ncbi:FAD/NAD(P)-binding domain-containing protein [Saccharata proteae CBS 121410]|uniref:FAD/NAD(P)-binding domain-containing protein n=1 Tax=Saccharata proteae CBS 121410 TaxID=1314787 RepID=A0A9P4LYP4_9PEZI|nr:FAD/NAD(P)-binding domain-containing protein [Saccharata proteae CBS 121410]